MYVKFRYGVYRHTESLRVFCHLYHCFPTPDFIIPIVDAKFLVPYQILDFWYFLKVSYC